MLKKRTVMHKEALNVKVKILKSDFSNWIYKDRDTNKEYLLAGALVKVKGGADIRETGAFVEPISTGDKADGILIHDIEFNFRNTEETAAVSIEGVTYLDKLIEVGNEYPTAFTVSKTQLPEKVTYIYKNRK